MNGVRDGGPPLIPPRAARAIIGLVGVVVAAVLTFSIAVVIANTRSVEDDGDPLWFEVLLPDDDGDRSLRFSARDVQGLGLRASTWPSSEGPSDDVVVVETGFFPGHERPEYCFRDDVVVIGGSLGVAIESGTCIDGSASFDLTGTSRP